MLVCGVMEHIEEAGIHSGDSACVLPPITLGADQVAAVEEATARLGRALGVVGILNVQFAFKGQRLYVLEANPRASRSVPFVEKVTGLPVAKAAALLMTGSTLAGLASRRPSRPTSGSRRRCCRSPASRGRLAARPGDALHRRGAGDRRPLRGRVRQEPGGRLRGPAGQGGGLPVGPQRRQAGHRAAGQAPRRPRLHPGRDHRHGRGPAPQRDGGRDRPQGPRGPDNVVDRIRAGRSTWSSTPPPPGAREDGYDIRIAAVAADIPCITTLSGLTAVVQGIEARLAGDLTVRPLQDWHDGHEPRPGAVRGPGAAPGQPTRSRFPGRAADRRARPARAVRPPAGRGGPLVPAAAAVLDPPGRAAGRAVEVVFDVVGAGTLALARLRPHDVVDALGPLGRPFDPRRRRPAACWSAAATAPPRCSSWPPSCGRGAAGSTS